MNLSIIPSATPSAGYGSGDLLGAPEAGSGQGQADVFALLLALGETQAPLIPAYVEMPAEAEGEAALPFRTGLPFSFTKGKFNEPGDGAPAIAEATPVETTDAPADPAMLLIGLIAPQQTQAPVAAETSKAAAQTPAPAAAFAAAALADPHVSIASRLEERPGKASTVQVWRLNELAHPLRAALAQAAPAKAADPATPLAPLAGQAKPKASLFDLRTSLQPEPAPATAKIESLAFEVLKPTVAREPHVHISAALPSLVSDAAVPALPVESAPPSAGEQVQVAIERLAGMLDRSEGVVRRTDNSVQADLQLHPADLGGVRIQLQVRDDGNVQALIVAERPETARLIQEQVGRLQDNLGRQGLSVERIQVGVQSLGSSSTDASPFGNTGSDGRKPSWAGGQGERRQQSPSEQQRRDAQRFFDQG